MKNNTDNSAVTMETEQLNISRLTLFSDHRSLFFISLLYFCDSVLICSMRNLTDSLGWLALLLSAVISAPLVLLACFYFEKRGVPRLLLYFSKAAAAVFISLFLILFADFIKKCADMEIAPWLISVFILLTALFAAFKDFNIIKRSASVFVMIIAVFLAFSLLLLADRIRISNISQPVFDSSRFLFQLGFYSLFFTIKGILLSEVIQEEKGIDRSSSLILAAGLFLSVFLIAVTQLITLTVLGSRLYTLVDYPVYYPLGLTRYGEYFERAEILSLAIFMITLTFKTSVLLRLIFPRRKNAGAPEEEETRQVKRRSIT